MSRNIGVCPDAPVLADDQSRFPARVLKTWDFEVITPLFGGGAEARDNDPLEATLIRPASVKGHLRFWWRAVKGAAFANAEAMREAEAEIWGSPNKRSEVELEIQVTSHGTPISAQDLPLDFVYAIFPFREERTKGTAAAFGREGVTFKLKLRFRGDHTDDVTASVLAWANFGGIGARTRRGCGSLFCAELAPASGMANEIQKKLGGLFANPPPVVREWPVLPGSQLLAKGFNKDRGQAWKEGLQKLKEFRQGANVGRNPGNGRSRWPEADSLRAKTNRSHNGHGVSITVLSPATEPAFPRAEFGLPIVEKFHFEQKGDHPNNCTIYPIGSERMSSPLIVKALAVPGGAVPMVLRLRTEPPGGVRVKFDTKTEWRPTGAHVQRPDLATYRNSPMTGRTTTGSALEAFMNFLRETGRDFKVIVP